MDADAAAAAKEDGRPIGGEPRPVGGEQQVGFQLVAQRGADLVKVGRADLLAHLDQEFGVEAEPAAARLAHRLQRGEIDRVLALVVGGAAAIDAVADRRCRPGIEPVAPLAVHARNDVAMAVNQYGRQLRGLAMLGDKEGRLAARRFHQPALEVERGKDRAHFLLQIGAQLRLAAGALAFGLVGDAPFERVQELAGGELTVGVGDGVGSCHFALVIFSWQSLRRGKARQRIGRLAGREEPRAADFALIKPAGVKQSRENDGPRHQRAGEGSSTGHDQGNQAQRLRHELRGASIAGAVDPSAPSLPLFAQFAVVLAGVVTKWRTNARTRNQLWYLNDHQLYDVGLTREAWLPFWK